MYVNSSLPDYAVPFPFRHREEVIRGGEWRNPGAGRCFVID